jgi:lysophospholipase L1-like esterase
MPARFPWKAVTVGGLVLGGLAALLRATSHSTRSTPPQRVALIGDSYAVGLGPELQKIFNVGRAENLWPEFKFEGVTSTRTDQWANHTAACGSCGDWLTAFKPDVVFVSLGVNDGATPNLANYQTIVRALHGIGARVVWIEPPAGVNAPAVRSVIASLGVSTVPAPVLPMANSIHPTVSGYAQWADKIAQALQSVGTGGATVTMSMAGPTYITKYRVQALRWGATPNPNLPVMMCDYIPTEQLEYPDLPSAQAGLTSFRSKYESPPTALVRLLKLYFDPKTFKELPSDELYLTAGPRNHPGPCG